MTTASRPPAAWARWRVLSDFDGTIAIDDLTDLLLLRFGRPGWEQLESDWRAGRIGSRECMAGQVALLDCSREELDAFLAGVAIDPQFAAFAAAVQGAGAPLRIVSDGLDLAIHTVLQHHGISGVEVFASRLLPVGPRRWKLAFPHARSDCKSAGATCKCALADTLPATAPRRPVLMIGDGASDFCVAGRADLTFARQELLVHCAEQGLRHLAVADFGQALAALRLLPAPPAAAPSLLVYKEALDARR